MDIKCLPVGALNANCYIISCEKNNECIVIDPGGDAQAIWAQMAGKHVACVLLTHGHFDHIAASDMLCKNNVPLYIHQNDAPMLESAQKNLSQMMGRAVEISTVPKHLSDGMHLSLAGVNVVVHHTPGHTKGSVCFEIDTHLFTGDTLFENGYGRCDLPGGDIDELMTSIKGLFKREGNRQVHPGHGRQTTLLKERENYR